MSRVTKIERQQKRQDRFNVFVDDKFEVGLSESEIISLNIYQGKKLTQKEIRDIKNHSSFVKIRDKAIRLLSIRPRSIAELEEKLELKKYDERLIAKVIDDLVKANLLNDKQFVADWINHRINFSSLGKKRIKLELWKKKISNDLIEKGLSRITDKKELVRALEIAERKATSYKDIDKRKSKEKMIAFLMRKGYSWNIVSKVLDKIKF